MSVRIRPRAAAMAAAVASVLVLAPAAAPAPQAEAAYRLPPPEIVRILDAPPTPRVVVSPRGGLLLLVDYEAMPTIAELSRPLLRIAGLRITPDVSGRQMLTFNTGLTLKPVPDGPARPVALPAGIRFGTPAWSPDGTRIAFARRLDDRIEAWVVDAKTGLARALPGPPLDDVLGPALTWCPDGRTLLVRAVPEGRGLPPEAARVPSGPDIQETAGKRSRVPTYQDLLKSSRDERLFDHYATVRLGFLDSATGAFRPVGEPAVYADAEPSPDGRWLLVARLKKPYSYGIAADGFARSVEAWNLADGSVRVLADLPAEEEVPPNGVPTGPRSFEWRPLSPATLLWAEALDGGDPERDAPFRDKLVTLDPPFDGAPREVARTRGRFAGITWLGKPGQAMVEEFDWKRRWTTSWLLDPSVPAGTAPRVLFDLSSQDEYRKPGRPVQTTTPAGERVAVRDGDAVFLAGTGASPEGDRPFLDRYDLKTGRATRMLRSAGDGYEAFVAFAGPDLRSVIITSESPTRPPNYVHLNLKTGARAALTAFEDPAPAMTGMSKRLIKYKRADGVDLSGTLYLPPGYKDGTRLPAVVWAYPLEYSDASTAGQVRGSTRRFTFFRGASQLFFVARGYAVLDNATMPVIGDPKTMNDTFVKQIVLNAEAAARALDELGVADPRRVGVGGHSYGAFMTANLLAHCDVFAAGIARSGAYNRTLTPFGFQSERRNLWEATDTYVTVSPFMHADTINEPILLIHGQADNNTGTFPIQSERLYAALKGFGATSRLVLLPNESHGYAARESVLHVLAEMLDWFDRYVKNRT